MPSPITSQGHPRRGSARRRRAGLSAPLLLLLGTPGTGKRSLGAYLAETRGFLHLDFEDAATRGRWLGASDEELRARFARLSAAGRGLVITWGAGPVTQLRHLRRLRRLGVELAWLDSDRGAARRAHYADVPRMPRLPFVDSFEPDGRFRPLEEVVAELLGRRPRRRAGGLLAGTSSGGRWRAEVPGRVAGSLAARVAGGLALAGATSFATVALLSAVGDSGARPPLAAGRPHAAPAVARVPSLPHRGVLVSGRSLAGVRLGDSMTRVRELWGGHFTRCTSCKPALWLYLYPPPDDPVGAGVQFAQGKVVAVFTLGAPAGWHTQTGLEVGQVLDNPSTSDHGSIWQICAGYSAKSIRTGENAVTSILTQGSAVYGFALTRPSVSPCQ